MVDTTGKCFKCSKKTNVSNPGLICNKCGKSYHGGCIIPQLDNLEMKNVAHRGWKCKKCLRNEEKSMLKNIFVKKELTENQRQLDINQELKSLLELAEMSLDELLEKHNKLIIMNKLLNQENLVLARRLAHLDGSYKMKVEFLEKLTQRKPPTVKADYIENALKMAKARDELAGGEDNVTKDFNTFAKYAGLKKHETWAFVLQGKVKRMSKSWFTHIALMLILILYTAIGAVIFQVLEGNNKIIEAKDKKTLIDEFSDRVDDNLKKFGSFANINQTNEYQQIAIHDMQQFEALVRKRFEYEGRVSRGPNELYWGFYSSFFFCSTVYTTIGYGSVYPVTVWGQIAVIIYATIGIPLFVITLADFGALLTRYLKYIWNCGRKSNKKTEKTSDPVEHDHHTGLHSKEHDKIPISLALTVLLIYLIVGGALFSFGEYWGYFDSIYFLFITITTVGYGDFVPTINWLLFLYMLYLFLGLVIGTMALNVIREKMVDTMDKTSAKFGHTLDIYIDEMNI